MSDLVFVLHAMNDTSIKEHEAPSPAARSLLSLARTRKGFDLEFVKSFVKPMYERMAREEEKKKARFDDGRDLTSFIAKVRAARVRAIRDGDADALHALSVQLVKVGNTEVTTREAEKKGIAVSGVMTHADRVALDIANAEAKGTEEAVDVSC